MSVLKEMDPPFLNIADYLHSRLETLLDNTKNGINKENDSKTRRKKNEIVAPVLWGRWRRWWRRRAKLWGNRSCWRLSSAQHEDYAAYCAHYDYYDNYPDPPA